MKSIVKNPDIAACGAERMKWFRERMPIITAYNERFKREQTFKGKVIATTMHIEPKSAYWIEGLLAGGAEHIYFVGYLGTTKDDTAAYLASLPRMTVLGKSDDTYEEHLANLDAVIRNGKKIDLFLDNGAAFILAHKRCNPGWLPDGANEETRSGRLYVEQEQYEAPYPIAVIDDSALKRLLENYTGVGQSIVDGFMRATSLLVGGKNVLVFGYGYCGSGVAAKFKGLGANTMVYDTNPLYQLKAKVDGHTVGEKEELIARADVIITVTGSFGVITTDHIPLFKNKVILANAGCLGFEIDLKGLAETADSQTSPRPGVDKYSYGEKDIYVLAGTHALNLASADGNPIEIMDLGLALQAGCAERIIKAPHTLVNGLQNVPDDISLEVCKMSLKAQK